MKNCCSSKGTISLEVYYTSIKDLQKTEKTNLKRAKRQAKESERIFAKTCKCLGAHVLNIEKFIQINKEKLNKQTKINIGKRHE